MVSSLGLGKWPHKVEFKILSHYFPGEAGCLIFLVSLWEQDPDTGLLISGPTRGSDQAQRPPEQQWPAVVGLFTEGWPLELQGVTVLSSCNPHSYSRRQVLPLPTSC